MRNSVEITRGYQFMYMLRTHLLAVFVSMAFEAMAFWAFLSKPIARFVVAGIFTIVYAGMIYSAAAKLGKFDTKTYTPLKPEPKFGLLWGLAISATVAVFLCVYMINWKLFSTDGGLNNIGSVIYNLFFCFWTAPYFGFYDVSGGGIPVFAIVLMLAVPVAASFIGYYAGMTRFDIIEKLDSMTFEKDDDEE